MQVQAVISAPGALVHQLSKKNLRLASVHLMGVLWETADFICENPKCQHIADGHGNYVTRLRDCLAWEIYCRETAGTMHVADHWEELGEKVREIFRAKADALTEKEQG